MGDQQLADMFDGGVSSVFSSFDATASQPAQNGAGMGAVNVGGLSPEPVPVQTVSENANLSGAGTSDVGKLLAQILPPKGLYCLDGTAVVRIFSSTTFY